MATINLLPWRDGLREQRKKQFIILYQIVIDTFLTRGHNPAQIVRTSQLILASTIQ